MYIFEQTTGFMKEWTCLLGSSCVSTIYCSLHLCLGIRSLKKVIIKMIKYFWCESVCSYNRKATGEHMNMLLCFIWSYFPSHLQSCFCFFGWCRWFFNLIFWVVLVWFSWLNKELQLSKNRTEQSEGTEMDFCHWFSPFANSPDHFPRL